MKSSTELQAELEAIINWFGSSDVDIDEAAKKYEQGLKIISTLQDRLKNTENTITKLRESSEAGQ